ncbi:MAG: hypothetical protein ACREEP_20775, partial [Dongiaceae bacterium]
MAIGDKTTSRDPGGEKDSAGDLWADLFVARLQPETRDGLSPVQLQDIRRVAATVAPGRHRMDWRFRLPALFGGRGLYGVLLAGGDRRGPQRQAQDRLFRRQERRNRSARANRQALAVGFALAALALMLVVGVVHAEETKSGIVGIEGAD